MTKYSARLTLVVSLLCLSTLGCGGHPGPTSATPTPGAVNPDPLPPSPAVRPSIATIAPDSGSIDGGAWSTITGTDFQPGATVQLGQQKAKQIVVKSTTVVVFWTEARAAGVVDVTVTNPGGSPPHCREATRMRRPHRSTPMASGLRTPDRTSISNCT